MTFEKKKNYFEIKNIAKNKALNIIIQIYHEKENIKKKKRILDPFLKICESFDRYLSNLWIHFTKFEKIFDQISS